jgi:hypothetical protein
MIAKRSGASVSAAHHDASRGGEPLFGRPLLDCPPADALRRMTGREGSLTIHQDVAIYSAVLGPRRLVAHPLSAALARRFRLCERAQLNGAAVRAGDHTRFLTSPHRVASDNDGETLRFDVS